MQERKKYVLLCLCLGLMLAFTGCQKQYNQTPAVSPTPEVVLNKPASSLHFENIQRIDVVYGGYSPNIQGGTTISIKDEKMLKDIAAMMEKSPEADLDVDMERLKNLRPEQINKLVIKTAKDESYEISFAADDLYNVGYIQADKKKYRPDYSFFRYLNDLPEYVDSNSEGFDTNVQEADTQQFSRYNWTIDYRINKVSVMLPLNLKHGAGENPIKLYWAYNNDLSKAIGLDFSGYLGKTLEAEIYRLREPLPEFMMPRQNARGILLKSEGKIIGAYIDAGRHDAFACTLDRQSLEQITHKKWNQWLEAYIDYTNPLENKLAKMQPEQIIRTYFDALNKQDGKTIMGCMSRAELSGYLAMNMSNRLLYNTEYNVGGIENIKSARLVSVRSIKGMENPPGVVEYEATVDYKYKKVITSESGVQSRFILLKKESERCGWRITGIGTGP